MPGPKISKGTRDEIVAIDIGARMTKAICLRRKGTEMVLVDYALVPTPLSEKGLSTEGLTDLLRQTVKALKTNARRVVLTLGAAESVLTHADLPQTSVNDLRRMVKLSPKAYLQQELPDHLFDCFFRKPAKGTDTTAFKRKKSKVLVAAARRRVVEDLCDAAKAAGLVVHEVTTTPVALANAFRLIRDDSHPDPTLLLDIGASHSIIGIVQQGELVLARTVALGADKFSDVLAPSARPGGGGLDDEMSPEAIQSRLQKAVLTFAREVDASAGFYSSQHEKHISQLFVSGGTARSQLVLQMLESELSFSCEGWNLVRHLTVDMPEQRVRELEYEIPQLTVAIGAAAGVLREDSIQINLLAEEKAAAEARRTDPVRRAVLVAAAAVALMIVWAASLGVRTWRINQEVDRVQRSIPASERGSGKGAVTAAFQISALRNRARDLTNHVAQRLLHGSVLNSLQRVVPPELTLSHLHLERLTRVDKVNSTNGPTVYRHEQYQLTLQVMETKGVTGAEDPTDLLDANIRQDPYLSEWLSPTNTIHLADFSGRSDQKVRMLAKAVLFKDRVQVELPPPKAKTVRKP